MRRLVEDQNARLSAIEEENRALRRQLEAPEELPTVEDDDVVEEAVTEEPRPERSLWRRLAGVFGRG